MLMVPGTTDFGETLVLIGPLAAQDPQPYWGSRNLRDNSLILVITGVEAGDGGPSRRSAGDRACAPDVGGQPRPVVDTWTSRRLCTVVPCRPRPVPCLPPARPQFVPRPAAPGVRTATSQVNVVPERGVPRRSRSPTCRWPADMTSCDLAHTRSPQPVHIPGDNSSTCRLRGHHRSPISGRPRGSAWSTAPPRPVDMSTKSTP